MVILSVCCGLVCCVLFVGLRIVVCVDLQFC